MRLDQYLVQNGYFESRNKAALSVKDGCFTVGGKVVFKPSYNVSETDVVTAIKTKPIYVARSAHKLLRAFQCFSLSWEGKTVADLGASTGGFCQVLLEKGVRKIYAVDIGTAQLHPSIAADDRIVNMEHTNARYITEDTFPEPVEVITADLSFISVQLVLPAIFQTLTNCGEAVILVKPQFEAGPAYLNKNGVVTDRKVHRQILIDVAAFSENLGFSVSGIQFSGLAGESGNREYLLYLKKDKNLSVSILKEAEKAVNQEEDYE